MNKNVVYTAIFGGYDKLRDPVFVPEGWDFVCFSDTDQDSDIWDVHVITLPVSGDTVRSARMVKILTHKFLPSYDVSIWVDGNILIRGDVEKAMKRYVPTGCVFAAYSHWATDEVGRDGIYQEAEALIQMSRAGKYKDDPAIMRSQVEGYRAEGYPEQAGLIVTSVLFRRHNDPVVKTVMEDWWGEVRQKSRRDQLSFNYVAWKHRFDFNVINENGWDNPYFVRGYHHVPLYKKPWLYIRYLYRRTQQLFGGVYRS